MFEIDKTRKHFVPKHYLRGFGLSDHPARIYVFDKERPEEPVTVRSISNVEVSSDAYSVANDAILTERERSWSQILNILKGRSISELNEWIADRQKSATLRAGLARFVVDSRLRSRGFRDQMGEPVNAIRLQFRATLKAMEVDYHARFPDLAEQWNVIFPLVSDMTGVESDRKFKAIRLDPFLRGEEGERRYRWYEEGSWRFDAAPEDRKFITSDIPSSSLLLGPELQYRNWMWFVMPLTAELRLIGMCGDARMVSGLAPRVEEVGDREMDLANTCLFQSAERFVYASSKIEILRASQHGAV